MIDGRELFSISATEERRKAAKKKHKKNARRRPKGPNLFRRPQRGGNERLKRTIVDTNVIVNGIEHNRSYEKTAINSLEKRGLFVMSGQVYRELFEGLKRRPKDKYLDDAARLRSFMRKHRKRIVSAGEYPPEDLAKIPAKDNDRKVVMDAKSGKVDEILTSDKRFVNRMKGKKPHIIAIGDFLRKKRI